MLIVIGGGANAQHLISLNGKQLFKVNEDDDNTGKKLALKLKTNYAATAALEVKELKPSKKMIRSYMVYDEQDNELIKLVKSKKPGTQQVLIKGLLKKLEAGKKYFLYTIAIPSDPKLAAAVRVRRILLCAVTVE